MKSSELNELKNKVFTDTQSDNFIRVHRAISWLKQAEECMSPDLSFICTWAGFNACYAANTNDIKLTDKIREKESERTKETTRIWQYLKEIEKLDQANLLWSCLWHDNQNEVITILYSQFLFKEFWKSIHDDFDDMSWMDDYKIFNQRASIDKSQNNVLAYCFTVLQRVYVLRNQLVHGGATHGSSLNRDQVLACSNFMIEFLPIIIKIMIDNPKLELGDLMYPPIYFDDE